MILKMTDDTKFYITKKQAEQIELAVSRGNDHVLLPNSLMIKTKNILSILPGSDPSHVEAAHILNEGRRVATDEGVRAAREKLDAKMSEIRQRKHEENLKNLMSRPIHRNIPPLFDKKKGSVPGWDELYGK